MADRPDSRDWLLERVLKVTEETERKTVWLFGGFIVTSFLAIAVNLGAISSSELNLLFLKTDLGSAWPVRTILVLSSTMLFLMIIYMVLDMQKTLVTLEYLASRNHDRAIEIAKLGQVLQTNHRYIPRAQGMLINILTLMCLAVVLLTVLTFVISLLN